MPEAPKILLFDDVPEFVLLTAVELVTLGYQVKVVFNGPLKRLEDVVLKYIDDERRRPIIEELLTSRNIIWDKNPKTTNDLFTDHSEKFLTVVLETELKTADSNLVILTDQGVSTAVLDRFEGTELAVIARQKGFVGPILIHSQKGGIVGDAHDYSFMKIDVKHSRIGAELKEELEAGIAAAQARISGTSAKPASPAAGGSWTGLAQRDAGPSR